MQESHEDYIKKKRRGENKLKKTYFQYSQGIVRKFQYLYISEELQPAYEDRVRYISSGVNSSFFKTRKIACGGEWLMTET